MNPEQTALLHAAAAGDAASLARLAAAVCGDYPLTRDLVEAYTELAGAQADFAEGVTRDDYDAVEHRFYAAREAFLTAAEDARAA